MLVLQRKNGERILCEESGLAISVIKSKKGKVWIGIQAPPEMVFLREEVALLKRRLALAEIAQPEQQVA